MSDLDEFEVVDVTPLERSWTRIPDPDFEADLNANIDIQVIRAAFQLGENGVQVETQYVFSVEGVDSEGVPTRVGEIRSRFMVTLRAASPISTEAVDAGYLHPAQFLASVFSHPYHRHSLSEMTKEMSFPPYSLPMDYSAIAVHLEEANSARERGAADS